MKKQNTVTNEKQQNKQFLVVKEKGENKFFAGLSALNQT